MSSIRNVPAADALRRLEEGNRRWVADVRSVSSLTTASHRAELAAGQSPFAVVLSCSDSRVPSEMVFDQGLGSIFVVRVAGNVVAPSLVGSIEFAVQTFGVGLVVVMGHTACGAVSATVDAITRGETGGASDNVLDIVRRIRPAVEPLVGTCDDRHELIGRAARANVVASASQLRKGSTVLAQEIAAGRLLIVGAEYSLDTGAVDFFDVPRAARPQVATAASTPA
jgi:carbonic anhydrase